MTSDSQPEKLRTLHHDAVSKPSISEQGFQALRIDGSENLAGAHSLSGKHRSQSKVASAKQLTGNKRIQVEPRDLSSIDSSVDKSDAPTTDKYSQGRDSKGNYQVPGLQKLKFLEELNRFLDDLSLRIHDLEARENFVSHSLLLLDHERRQFRLWKSMELCELEHQKNEWKLSNYDIPKAEIKPELSLQDQVVIKELRATVTIQDDLKQEDKTVHSVVGNLAKPVEITAEIPVAKIKQEQIYILDVHDEDAFQEMQVTSAPSLKLPEEIQTSIISSVEQFPSVVKDEEFESGNVPFEMSEIQIEFPATEKIDNAIDPAGSVVVEFQVIEVGETNQTTAANLVTQNDRTAENNLQQTQTVIGLPEPGVSSQAELLKQQQEWELLREQQLEDLERRQKLSLKQIRFQKEHLEKLRREYEHERNESFYELQQLQTRIATSAQILELQQHQYRQARQLLDERTESLMREESILRELMKLAQEQHTQAEVEVEYIYSLEARLKSAMEKQELEFKRQEEQLQHLVQLITPKQKQLLLMQKEIEQSHRETLIIREALRHAWQKVKGDIEFPELERAYEHQKETLHQQLETNLQGLINQFTRITQQDQHLLNQVEDGLRTGLEVLETIRQELPILVPPVSDLKAVEFEVQLREREHWLEEKLDAERIIRQLVDQLEQRISLHSEFLQGDEHQAHAA
jgi:hypothetical protein